MLRLMVDRSQPLQRGSNDSNETALESLELMGYSHSRRFQQIEITTCRLGKLKLLKFVVHVVLVEPTTR
jgi:hypothetical protein